MTLSPGTRIGAYEITALLGAGGMGEVYRARDTRLGRDVAVKILPDAVATDRERVARFQREAQTLAALNHPHIAAIHGLEETDGMAALIMELVEGEELAKRLARGAIPADEALAIAGQIAEAFEAAHDQGIVHRDLKPANVKIRPDGTGQGPRLRPGEGERDGLRRERPGELAHAHSRCHRARRHPRHGGLHGTGAGQRPDRRQARGHLGLWLRALRDADGPARIRR